jgi:hypothetical protein
MAKRAKIPERKTGGPFLAAAVFCENILEDSDRTVSVIRIIDGVQIVLSPQAPADIPSPTHPFPVTLNILLIFRTGDSPGEHNLKLQTESPDGKRDVGLEQVVTLSPEPNGGLSLKTLAGLAVHCNGVHLIDVSLDGKLVTRMPLNVQITRAEMPTDSTAPASGEKAPPSKGKKKK